jgi:hypothetical protein
VLAVDILPDGWMDGLAWMERKKLGVSANGG